MVDLAAAIHALRPADADYLIVSLGAHGPNIDMPEGNVVATVRMGTEEATAEAKYLPDAVSLARAAILRDREAKKKAAEKGRAK